jgi:hypothetical protein
MPEENDIDELAGEYVLGSLDMAERQEVNARREEDVALAAAIAAWERRLAPLSARARGISPPPHLFDGILARISAQQTQTDVVPLRRPLRRRWALPAASASALAACLVMALVWSTGQPSPEVQGRMDCGKLYKDFWQNRDPQSYERISPDQLAGVSRMALRAYDACQAGDEQDARAVLARLREHRGGPPLKSPSLPG